MKKYLLVLLLIIILSLAILTRLYKLGYAPAGLYLDEAGQGYSAYSILLTGKDEFGKSFPFVFRSFTDFKTPVYIYLIVPLIPIFGLTSFTVRFPSFFFSILTFPVLYLLIRKIAPDKYTYRLSLIACLTLAISPWHILFGRTNFECNVALFFFLGGVYLFYRGLTKPWYLILSAVLFAIALPAYHAQRIITPIMVLLLFIKHKKVLLSPSHKKALISAVIIGFIITIPTLTVATTPGFLARATGLNIFSVKDKTPSGTINEDVGFIAPVVNNRIFLTSKEFASLYLSYFSPRYMFLLGDYGPRSSFPELSTFFVWQAPFYIYGLYKFLKDKNLGELKFFTLSMLIISPIPAAVTRDPYSTIRSLQMVIPLIIIITFGLISFWNLIKTKFVKSLLIFAFIGIVLYSLAKLYSSVIILNEYYRAREWDYGWQSVAETIKTLDASMDVIVDSARHGPYIELLFFLKYDPRLYVEGNFEVSTSEYYTNMNRRDNWKLGNIIIRPIDWGPDTRMKQYLIGDRLAISDAEVQKHNLKIIRDIYYPDGVLAFRIVETNPK